MSAAKTGLTQDSGSLFSPSLHRRAASFFCCYDYGALLLSNCRLAESSEELPGNPRLPGLGADVDSPLCRKSR